MALGRSGCVYSISLQSRSVFVPIRECGDAVSCISYRALQVGLRLQGLVGILGKTRQSSRDVNRLQAILQGVKIKMKQGEDGERCQKG